MGKIKFKLRKRTVLECKGKPRKSFSNDKHVYKKYIRAVFNKKIRPYLIVSTVDRHNGHTDNSSSTSFQIQDLNIYHSKSGFAKVILL